MQFLHYGTQIIIAKTKIKTIIMVILRVYRVEQLVNQNLRFVGFALIKMKRFLLLNLFKFKKIYKYMYA